MDAFESWQIQPSNEAEKAVPAVSSRITKTGKKNEQRTGERQRECGCQELVEGAVEQTWYLITEQEGEWGSITTAEVRAGEDFSEL